MKRVLFLISLCFFLYSCASSPKSSSKAPSKPIKSIVSKGDKVFVYYKGRYPSGNVFDERLEGSNPPISFIAGAGMMIVGFDRAVIGMKLGEEKEVVISPKYAYGEYKKSLLRTISRDSLRKSFVPKLGARIRYSDGKGTYSLFPIVAINDKSITVDLNHNMAGKTLIFNIKIASIE